MIARLTRFVANLTRRERILLALLVLGAVPAGLVQGIALPLLARNHAADTAVAEAEALRAWLQERQRELATLPPDPGAAQSTDARDPAGLSALEDSLAEADLRDTMVSMTNPRGAQVSMQFDAADFVALMPWLDRVEARMGYHVALLRITGADAPGTVTAEITLEPAP
ncbi:MAG: general secretion pathway protein M [Rhodobacteraceae bacterium HLUCCA12]|nr:MAG: general secretion pathway protein M [Rhodobacteraceae bacterium HLUCCA12]